MHLAYTFSIITTDKIRHKLESNILDLFYAELEMFDPLVHLLINRTFSFLFYLKTQYFCALTFQIGYICEYDCMLKT